MKRLLLLLVLLVATSAGSLVYVGMYYQQPNALVAPVNVIIHKGTPSPKIAEMLAEQGIIAHPYLFAAMHYATGQSKQFKAGEYAFDPGATPQEVATKLMSGDVVIHKVTIPEGYNVREVVALLMIDPVLQGEITKDITEGSLLPETYHFIHGDTRDLLLGRMQEAMQKALAEAWKKRAKDLPFNTAEEALIMASIIEKETGVDYERGRVAAVFINRLKKGMMLQADPTVAYGVEQATGKPLERELTTHDLKTPTPYNTYIIPGLPPTPIANPGLDSIEAALNPDDTNELYFVATGDGGHYFASTLAEHNRNVAKYRKKIRGN